jgi:hypothetical protein
VRVTIYNVGDLVDAELEGRVRTYEWVKNVTQTTTAGIWYDLTGASGNPKAKQWFDAAPLTAAGWSRAATRSTSGSCVRRALRRRRCP